MTKYVVGPLSLDYNDEYYSYAGEDGAIVPTLIVDTEDQAKQIVREKIALAGWEWRELSYDANFDTRMEWYENTTESDSRYGYEYVPDDFDVDAFKQWVTDNDKDIFDCYPFTWNYFKVEEV